MKKNFLFMSLLIVLVTGIFLVSSFDILPQSIVYADDEVLFFPTNWSATYNSISGESSDDITSIIFTDSITKLDSYVADWGDGEDKFIDYPNNKIQLLHKNDSDFDIAFVSSSTIYAPIDSSNLFGGKCKSIESFVFNNFDTSKVTNICSMFSECSALTSLDLSSFNTSNVIDVNLMLYDCNSLTSLDLSSFDTSNVTNMSGIFCGCSAIPSLDLSNFITSKVTNMSSMFKGCNKLTSLKITNFKTGNVTTMQEMFADCNNLKSLDVTNFKTTQVHTFKSMFENCSSIRELDLSSFNIGDAIVEDIFKGMYLDMLVNPLNIQDEISIEGSFYSKRLDKHGINKLVKEDSSTSYINRRMYRDYKVRWYGMLGEFIEEQLYGYSLEPEMIDVQEEYKDAQYTFIFKEWEKTLKEDNSLEYTAIYITVLNTFKVTWKHVDGTVIREETYSYGEKPVYSYSDPTREVDFFHKATFVGWDKEVEFIDSDVEFIAIFKEEMKTAKELWWIYLIIGLAALFVVTMIIASIINKIKKRGIEDEDYYSFNNHEILESEIENFDENEKNIKSNKH